MNKSDEISLYLDSLPNKEEFEILRKIVSEALPNATECISFKMLAYKISKGMPLVFIHSYKNRLALYPAPISMLEELKPYLHSKRALWFKLDEELPKNLIVKIVETLLLESGR